jgi:hypothetical protein
LEETQEAAVERLLSEAVAVRSGWFAPLNVFEQEMDPYALVRRE